MQVTPKKNTVRDRLTVEANERIMILNKYYGRHVDHQDFVTFMPLPDYVQRGYVTLSINGEPFTNSINCAWIVLFINQTAYLIRRDMCLAMKQEKEGFIRVAISLMMKVIPVQEPLQLPVVDNNNNNNENNNVNEATQRFRSIEDDMVAMKAEITKLNTTVSELKRKHDEYNRDDVIDGTNNGTEKAVGETRKCEVCEKVSPVETFREASKRTNKNGEVVTSFFLRKKCRACRRKKVSEQKKAKVC